MHYCSFRDGLEHLILIILIINIIVSYDQNISMIFYMWKMDPMLGCDIRLVFTLPPRDSTLQYRRCVHLWNNFPCIINLICIRFMRNQMPFASPILIHVIKFSKKFFIVDIPVKSIFDFTVFEYTFVELY